MKLPVIKSLIQFIDDNDEDYIVEALEVIEHLSQARGLSESEIEVISELISNMYGSLEVHKLIKTGTGQKDALNGFMQRVMGSIDR